MFTGIIEETGVVRSITGGAGGYDIGIRACKVLQGTSAGDSIAVNGVCLTVTSLDGSGFNAQIMPETLRRSSLGELGPGSEVNLERAMRADGRFGGHIVSGHVDACGKVVSIVPEGIARTVEISVPGDTLKYIAAKGSVAIDGASLTVTWAGRSSFKVSLIPHTVEATTLKALRTGNKVNVEVDPIALYVERLLSYNNNNNDRKITMEFLYENGF